MINFYCIREVAEGPFSLLSDPDEVHYLKELTLGGYDSPEYDAPVWTSTDQQEFDETEVWQ